MKKIVFASLVFGLLAMLPVYIVLELNHSPKGSISTTGLTNIEKQSLVAKQN